MSVNAPIFVELSKYIDDTVERPVIRGRDVTVADVAHQALGCSWGVAALAYKFGIDDVEVLAAILYYDRFSDRVNALEGDIDSRVPAMD